MVMCILNHASFMLISYFMNHEVILTIFDNYILRRNCYLYDAGYLSLRHYYEVFMVFLSSRLCIVSNCFLGWPSCSPPTIGFHGQPSWSTIMIIVDHAFLVVDHCLSFCLKVVTGDVFVRLSMSLFIGVVSSLLSLSLSFDLPS